MAKAKMNDALNKVSEFINFLNTSDETSDREDYGLFFSLTDEGTILLNVDDTEKYRKTLRLLIDSVGNEMISQKAIESLFQETILTVIDIQEKRKNQLFSQRLENALSELRKSLTTSPSAFNVYHPVHGLALDGLPIQIGNVQFCIFDEVHLALFVNLLNGPDSNKDTKRINTSFAETIKEAEINGKTVGLISVNAIDVEAAKTLALKELSLTLDVLNFFSDLIPYQKGYIYLPGHREKLKINILTLSKNTKTKSSFGWSSVGPLQLFSFNHLLENNKKRNLGFTRVSDLLIKKQNRLEEKLISALQWAGKATIESRREEAFLLYAISLESLVLLENEKEELTFRLRTRVAHLLGKDIEDRKRITNEIRDLYGIRSKIVHSGSYQVTDADLSLIRFYSKNCILRILNDEPFKSMNSIEALVEWFNEKMLS